VKEITEAVTVKSVSVNREILFIIMAFVIPFTLSSPQWLTGTIVNALLIVASYRMSFKKLIPVIVLPSLGTFAHGAVFGPLTIFLAYFIPFIWISNFLLIKTFSIKQVRRWSYPYRLILAAFVKTIFLFTVAVVMVQLKLVPPVFLSAMGILQLATALSGGLAAYLILKSKLI